MSCGWGQIEADDTTRRLWHIIPLKGKIGGDSSQTYSYLLDIPGYCNQHDNQRIPATLSFWLSALVVLLLCNNTHRQQTETSVWFLMGFCWFLSCVVMT